MEILIFIAGVIIFASLLFLGIRKIKSKNIKIEKLGKMLMGFALVLFAIPWIYWIFNLSVVMKFQHIIPETLSYFREPFLIIFTLTSLASFVLGKGILKEKKWSQILSISLMTIIILICLAFLLYSLWYALFVSGDMDVMAAGICAFLIGPSVMNFVLLPSLLFLFCLTRPNIRQQFK